MLIFDGLQPDYVLDKMQMYELRPLVENHFLRAKENWEQTRLLAYIMVQCNSTKELKMTDIVTFPWDENKEEHDTEVSDKERDRLSKLAEIYKKYV